MDNNHQLTGRLHSIETFGTVDGPGIRVVLFFQGCPMRCQYCHNRDTWDTAGGREWTLEDLKQFVLRFKPYMDTSGGGVTATGGDPVLQHRFITRLFTQLKEEGVHTALDTSGFCRYEDVKPLIDVTDLVILDIKAVEPGLHKRLAGQNNAMILRFADKLRELNKPVWLRHVLVPGLTDSEEELLAFRRIALSMPNAQRLELLPYHTMGRFKWEEMGLTYPLEGVPDASKEDMTRAYKILNLPSKV